MSSNYEMYSILTPCLSRTPTPTPTPFFSFSFLFFSLRAFCFSKVLSAISSSQFFFLPTRF